MLMALSWYIDSNFILIGTIKKVSRCGTGSTCEKLLLKLFNLSRNFTWIFWIFQRNHYPRTPAKRYLGFIKQPWWIFFLAKIVNSFNFFMTEIPTIEKPVHWFQNKSMDWFIYDREVRNERVKPLTS